jgi:hypothetical protein
MPYRARLGACLQSLATLLLAGRLVNPHTAVPAPLLAAAARQHQQQQQQQQPSSQQQQQQQQRGPDGAAALAAAGQGPAVALMRCATEQDAAAALALNGRRLYSPSVTRSGGDTWRPITVGVADAYVCLVCKDPVAGGGDNLPVCVCVVRGRNLIPWVNW